MHLRSPVYSVVYTICTANSLKHLQRISNDPESHKIGTVKLDLVIGARKV